eukprot:TRINITY_DN8460_c1_g1_i1.p1 TRINITY_DN8460_c1_g1~~TRINITY_DN8460_c1_g1_i1.p1  ORF type:complete len:194 (-),score=53.72 TRINITY_DN8460_c1_g1_i1:792-1373(-)
MSESIPDKVAAPEGLDGAQSAATLHHQNQLLLDENKKLKRKLLEANATIFSKTAVAKVMVDDLADKEDNIKKMITELIDKDLKIIAFRKREKEEEKRRKMHENLISKLKRELEEEKLQHATEMNDIRFKLNFKDKMISDLRMSIANQDTMLCIKQELLTEKANEECQDVLENPYESLSTESQLSPTSAPHQNQ